MSPRDPKRGRGRWDLVPMALAVSLSWIALLVWQIVEYDAHAGNHRRSLEQAGHASLGMLEAAVRSIGRGRRQRPEFLQVVFDEIASVPGLRGAWLTEPDGTPIYELGGSREFEDASHFRDALWLEEGILIGRQVDIGACPFDGQGRQRSESAMARPSYLFLLLDRAGLDREVKRDLKLRVVVLTVAALAAVGVFLLVAARTSARRLRTELLLAEERARRHREWALVGAGLAHETKNPLAVVRGIAQRLVEGTASDRQEQSEQLQRIVDEVDTVVARINEFLHYSKPVEPRRKVVDLHDVGTDLAKLIEPDLAGCKECLKVEGDPARVLADPDMLRQILLNLLVNAARAIAPGGQVRMVTRVENDGTVTLEVQDDGPGIPTDQLEKVFEPYYSRTPRGTGLGLAIVRRLAEAHDWRVELESEVGVGTTIRLCGMTQAAR